MTNNDRAKQIKIFVSRTDHNCVRIAAALQGTGIGEFGRHVILKAARRLTKHIQPSTGTETVPADPETP